jgi:hypothetical protein
VANLEVQKSQNIRGGFALHFFGGGGLKRLVNVSHSSFCISVSLFELKLDLARERVSCLCFEREVLLFISLEEVA